MKKKRSKSQLTVIGYWLFVGGLMLAASTAGAQEVSINGLSTLSSQRPTNSHGWGKGGKPKPSPTPVDAQISWSDTGTNFNSGSSWTGGTAPTTADVAAFTIASPTNQPALSSSLSVGGLYFTVGGYTLSAASGQTLTLVGSGSTAISGGGTSNAAPAIQADNTSGINTITAPLKLESVAGTTSTIYQAAGGELIISGLISDDGVFGETLIKSGDGTLTLSGANTYSGGTVLNAGILQLGSNSTGSITSGPVGTGRLTLNGGTLSSNVGDFITTRTIANPITFGGDVTFGTSTNFGALSLTGAGTLTGNRTLTFVANVTLSGNISESGGSFGITKNGSGTLILEGNNSYSGGTTINLGLVELKNVNALGSTSAPLTVNGDQFDYGILDLNGQSISVGNLTGTGGKIWNNGPNAGSSTATLTIGTGNASGGNYQGVIADNNDNGSGKVALTKTGTGTITLSGANTYTGATTVNAGTLLINGSTAAGSAVTVNNTGTLGGTGTIGGTVTVNSGGTLSPGTSPGILHTGAVTLNDNSNFNIDITGAGGTANAGNTYDQLSVTGTVSLGGVLGSNLVLNVSGLTQANVGQAFFILSNDGTDAITSTFAQGATISSGSDVFTIDYVADFGTGALVGGNDIALVLTAVPEPSTYVAAALAAFFIGYSLSVNRRRRKQA